MNYIESIEAIGNSKDIELQAKFDTLLRVLGSLSVQLCEETSADSVNVEMKGTKGDISFKFTLKEANKDE